jgi:putative FmdB family regulatory protein
MPVYQYRCKNCELLFEKYKKIKDRDHVFCPRCKSKDIVRNFSSPSIIFNSDGFYATDNKKENKRRK